VAESFRPKNVVIVDAENPLVEIHGEFFWREDHDRIVIREREAAFKAGYGEGFAAGFRAASAQQRVVVRYRQPMLRRIVTRLFWLLITIAFLVTLIGGMLSDGPGR
jgi:hypothetical protein